MALPRLLWDWGTAYDLFVSLEVLHNPAEYGLRGAWAAGMRARLPTDAREMLESSPLLHVPLHWIHALPESKDSATALWTLGRVPPADRLAALALSPDMHADVKEILQGVAARRSWNEGDKEALRAAYAREKGEEYCYSPGKLGNVLEWWARPEESGERYLEALRTYQESFFAEEEKRIRPALQEALSQAQKLAEQLAMPDLLEELSQGLRLTELPEVTELVLVPSYWCTPFVFFERVGPGRELWLFGARPADASLVPGEVVPETLLRALKALSDPTRLRILRYLAEEPLTPAQLSRRLRLRASTVTHHLGILRQAGLVQLTLETGKRGMPPLHYAARSEAVAAAFASLKSFLEKEEQRSKDLC